jgi:hypothetical protein
MKRFFLDEGIFGLAKCIVLLVMTVTLCFKVVNNGSNVSQEFFIVYGMVCSYFFHDKAHANKMKKK